MNRFDRAPLLPLPLSLASLSLPFVVLGGWGVEIDIAGSWLERERGLGFGGCLWVVRRLVLLLTLEMKGSSSCMVDYLGLLHMFFVLSYAVTTGLSG